MHQAPRGGIEGIAPVQGAAVVPHHHVADAPFLAEDELRLRRVRPQRIEQRLALREFQPLDVAIAAPTEEQKYFLATQQVDACAPARAVRQEPCAGR